LKKVKDKQNQEGKQTQTIQKNLTEIKVANWTVSPPSITASKPSQDIKMF